MDWKDWTAFSDAGWLAWCVASAVFLGLYDLAKKASVRDNAVPPVLFLNVVTGAGVYGLVILVHAWGLLPVDEVRTALSISWLHHAQLFCKAVLVGISWMLAFHALKHLPLSIATPIRSTSPMWTVWVAVWFFAERPSLIQWLGVCVIVVAFLAFAGVGNMEGIRFRRDRWVLAMIAATLLGATSSIYDKYLIQSSGLAPITVQTWFSIYLVPVMLPQACVWWRNRELETKFEFRSSIPAIAILLLLADYCYFSALSHDGALVALISPMRRTSVAIPFVYGLVVLGERNWRKKSLCLAAMLIGVWLLSR